MEDSINTLCYLVFTLLWKHWLDIEAANHSVYSVGHFGGTILAVFVICALVEKVRQELFYGVKCFKIGKK